MRINFAWLAVAVTATTLICVAQTTPNRFPINRGVLQTDADGNNKSWTNLNQVVATNYIDAKTGLPINNSGGPFNGNPNQFGTDPGNHIIVKSGAELTNTVLFGPIGDGNGITNVNAFNQTINPFGVNAYGNGSNWIWMAAEGAFKSTLFNTYNPSGMALWTSLDGTNWSKTFAKTIYEPNQFTNGIKGPLNYNWSLLFTNGQWWAAAAHDPQNRGGLAPGVDLWRSTDLTNWAREIVIYPIGTSNVFGQIAGATWFRDQDMSTYLILSVATNVSASSNWIAQIKATDGTLTNYGAPVILQDLLVTGEGNVVRTSGGQYYLYYRNNVPNLEWFRATNNTMTSKFVLAPDAAGNALRGTNWGWGAFGNGGNAGELTLINYQGSKWRAYMTDESSVTATVVSYIDSPDDFASWSANWQTLTTATNMFGGGLGIAPAAATNRVFYSGETNIGQSVINTPLLRANSIQSLDGLFRGGLVASSLYTLGPVTASGITTPNTITADSIRITGFGQSNTVDISAGNFIIGTSGNVSAVSYSGDGSQLTGLNAGNISSGTLANGLFPALGSVYPAALTNNDNRATINILSTSNWFGGTLHGAQIAADAFTNRAGTANTITLHDGSTQPKLSSLANGGANTLVHGTTPPAYSAVVEADQSLSDVTTLNVSSSKHGYAPKNDGNTAHFLNGNGAYTTPPNGGAGTDTTAWHQGGDTTGTVLGNINNNDFQIRQNENGGNNALIFELVTAINSELVNFNVGVSNNLGSSGFGEMVIGTHQTVGNGVTWPTIAGGGWNSIGANGNQAFVGGGASNQANGAYSVAFGQGAIAANNNAFVFNGLANNNITTSGSGGDNGKILLGGTGLEFTNVSYGSAKYFGINPAYSTNLMPVANAPDFQYPVQFFSTNNVVKFQACTNVDSTGKFYQSCIIFVTNTTPATPRAILPPANCLTNGFPGGGTPFVTNLTKCTFEQYGQKWTNMAWVSIF